MKKEILHSSVLKETCFKYVLDNGLELYVLPKRDQRSNFAIFGTRFGSVHTEFSVNGKEVFRMPQGIAHFLEHKLFESEEQDAFERFNRTGANSNAYTSFDRTCYLFACTDNFYESYDILLDFVQSPFFTEETVLKEQGIISQEIKMYNDMGSWRVYMNALKALYRDIPVNVDITGTVEEIAKITAEKLYKCYNSFYNPQNMFICVCGNIDEEDVYNFTCERILNKVFVDTQMLFENEPVDVCEKYITSNLEVSLPQFVLAFKNSVEKGKYISSKQRIIKTMLLDILVSKKSALYTEMLNEGLINNDFGAEVFDGPGYCSCMFMGESSDPIKIKEKISSELQRLREEGIDSSAFEMTKREMYGNLVKQFDSVDNIINHMVDGAVCGYNFLDTVDTINSITLNDLNDELKKSFDGDKSILSVVEPIVERE